MPDSRTAGAEVKVQHGRLFSKLPRKLRLQIYDFLFPPRKFHLPSTNDYLLKDSIKYVVARKCTAILATCRAIYNEAISILYTNTNFNVQCAWDSNHFDAAYYSGRELLYWLRVGKKTSDRFFNLWQARSLAIDIAI
jgi:hypothetical protein